MQFDDGHGRPQTSNFTRALHQRLVVFGSRQEIRRPPLRSVLDRPQSAGPDALRRRCHPRPGRPGRRRRNEQGRMPEGELGSDVAAVDRQLDAGRRVAADGDAPDLARVVFDGPYGRRRYKLVGEGVAGVGRLDDVLRVDLVGVVGLRCRGATVIQYCYFFHLI